MTYPVGDDLENLKDLHSNDLHMFFSFFYFRYRNIYIKITFCPLSQRFLDFFSSSRHILRITHLLHTTTLYRDKEKYRLERFAVCIVRFVFILPFFLSSAFLFKSRLLILICTCFTCVGFSFLSFITLRAFAFLCITYKKGGDSL